MLAPAAFPAFFFTLAGFVLFLLVTLSVPIIHSIFLLEIKEGVSLAGDTLSLSVAKIGVFGTCYGEATATVAGRAYSHAAGCTSPAVGYTVDSAFFGDASSTVRTVVLRGLAGSLILNPIACGFAGLALIFAFLAWFFASRVFEIFTFVFLVVAQVVGWISFWLDLALTLVARHRVGDYTDGVFTGHIGNALWIALGGACALTLGLFASACGVFGRYSSRYRDGPVAADPAGKPYGRRYL